MPDPTDWTPEAVESALRRAVTTLANLPHSRSGPAGGSGLVAAWPTVLREAAEAYGWHKVTTNRLTPSAEDIGEMDRALRWVWDWLGARQCREVGMVEDSGNVVLMRAAWLTWEKIVTWRLARWCASKAARGQAPIPGGNSIPSLRRIHRDAIGRIVQQLGGTEGRIQRAAPQVDLVSVVEVARRGENLGRGSHGPVHARARMVLQPRRRASAGH